MLNESRDNYVEITGEITGQLCASGHFNAFAKKKHYIHIRMYHLYINFFDGLWMVEWISQFTSNHQPNTTRVSSRTDTHKKR
jgi:hypothetical protein